MGEVNAEYIKPGMMLAADLKDANGRFLLGKGSVIEAKHIRIMKMWGVTSADIDGVEEDQVAHEEMNRIDPELLKKLRDYVGYYFLDPGDYSEHKVIKEMKRLCVLRLARHIEAGKLKLNQLKHPGDITGSGNTWGMPDEDFPTIDQLVEKKIQLSSLPDIYHQVVNVLNDPKSSASHLAKVIGKDPGLSSSLLKIVNSAFYSLPQKVSSITRAIALIGGKELSTIAMGISVIRFFKDIPADLVNMKKFWLHSIATGVLARYIAAQKVGLPEEEFFIAGLLHDIGRLILFREFPQTMTYAIRQSRTQHSQLLHVEHQIFRFDHSLVADRAMEKWNFPKLLRQTIRYHHIPLSSPIPIEASILYTANTLASAIQYGFSGEELIPPFPARVWDNLELSTSVLAPAVRQADRQVHEILHAFSLDQ